MASDSLRGDRLDKELAVVIAEFFRLDHAMPVRLRWSKMERVLS